MHKINAFILIIYELIFYVIISLMAIKNKILLITTIIILSASNSLAAYDTNLKKGDESAAVTEMQEFLSANKFLTAKPNGYFGNATFAAVKAFQKKYKISQTGTFGPVTRAKAKSLAKPAVDALPTLSGNVKATLDKSFTVGAWVPYWRAASGSAEVINNLNKIDIISPFSYEMEETGTIKKPMKLAAGTDFDNMIQAAKKANKLVVPSVLWWGDSKQRPAMEKVLADADLRGAIIFDLMAEVNKYGFDGIDIDYENKTAETKDSFSKFLTEAAAELHKNNKALICTIESRVPLEDKYTTVTPELVASVSYSNDFKVIGKVCDQVRIMAYDQDNTDVKLNTIRGPLYKPVADIDWVEKVLTHALWDIPAHKMIVGVPTYGNKYEVLRDSTGAISKYNKIGSMNWYYADAESKAKGLTPVRDASGELSYTYIDSTTGKEYLVWYSDAKAIADKVNIAKLYKIGGVTIFKVDGNNDKNIWNNF